jgi:hypothetical protein
MGEFTGRGVVQGVWQGSRVSLLLEGVLTTLQAPGVLSAGSWLM